jgi:predicted alpha-1,2-mannosidase
MFDQKVDPATYANVEDISGMIGQYIHGNEPSHHLAYLYSYAGAPLKTQARLKQIVDSQYKPTPDGLVGNDDLGQMSAWLIFTSLGFYPVAPASNQYVLGRPFVDRAVLHLPNGKVLTINSVKLSDDHGFVRDILLNGKSLDRTYVTHDELMNGGDLRFIFSNEKDAEWSHRSLRLPYSDTVPHS